MNALAFSRLPLLTTAAVCLVGLQTPAHGFLDFFKKGGSKTAPNATVKQQQEAAAQAMMAEARNASSGKASGIYESILKQYPFTDTAAEAAYNRAILIRQSGQLQDASEAFQKLIDQYRQSPRFADAIQQQYEIAEEAKGGKKQKNFIVIPMKLDAGEVIKLYEGVIANAPFGRFAPLAQFSIAEIHQDKAEKAQAIAAYQKVVDNYPNTSQASEAQFRIGQISNVAAMKSQDSGNLTATRDALVTYVATNPQGERAGEAQSMLQQVDSAEAQKSLNIGKFYESQGKTKSAAIYYNEALKFGTAEASREARVRLSELARIDPRGMSDANTAAISDYTVPAAVDLKGRADYVGPPAPELARLSQKPKMRADDGFQPIPLREPTLPVRPGGEMAPPAGSLLPPPDSSKPLLLPVPPAPAEAAPPPVPPAPGAPVALPAAPAAPPAEKK